MNFLSKVLPRRLRSADFPCPYSALAILFLSCLLSCEMSVIETIVRGVQNLPLREQVQVARYVHRLATGAQKERAEVLRRTHGVLDEADGEAFDQAMIDARRVEAHG
jgi:hypothetical protein